MTVMGTKNLALACCLFLAACNQGTQTSPTPAPVPNVPDLSSEVRKLQMDLLKLQFRVDALESGDASVSAEEQGYGVAKTSFGAFTISTRSVTPYLDGFKIKLRIGNLTTANFNGAKLTVTWGPPYDEKSPGEFFKNQKKKEFSLTNQFVSGAFTDVEVALTPAKPEDVKSLSVGIQLDQLSLRAR